jgi:hypothetical protein
MLLPVRIAAGCSVVFWVALLLFLGVEIAFDPSSPTSPPFAERASDWLILTFWLSACGATIASLWAAVAFHQYSAARRRGAEPVRGEMGRPQNSLPA